MKPTPSIPRSQVPPIPAILTKALFLVIVADSGAGNVGLATESPDSSNGQVTAVPCCLDIKVAAVIMLYRYFYDVIRNVEGEA